MHGADKNEISFMMVLLIFFFFHHTAVTLKPAEHLNNQEANLKGQAEQKTMAQIHLCSKISHKRK